MEQEKLDKLVELKNLFEAGILTKEELDAEKAKVFNTFEQNEKQATKTPWQNCEESTKYKTANQIDIAESTFSNANDSNDDEESSNTKYYIIASVLLAIVLFVLFYSRSTRNANSTSVEDSVYTNLGVLDVNEMSNETSNVIADDEYCGTFVITGSIYRLCESYAVINISRDSEDTYSGNMKLMLGSKGWDTETQRATEDFDAHRGTSNIEISARRANDGLEITMESYEISDPGDGTISQWMPKEKTKIFQLYCEDGYYGVVSTGRMNDIFDDYNNIEISKVK